MVDILRVFASNLNFTAQFVATPDGEYGALTNGSWTGIIGELYKRNADFSISELSVTHVRSANL